MPENQIVDYRSLDAGGRVLRGQLELRGREEGRLEEITGSIPFDSRSHEIFGFFEIVRRGAFRSTLERGDDVVALVNHNVDARLARRSAGTLDLAEEEARLAWSIDTPDTATGRDTVEEIRRGDLNGSSFAFNVRSQRWSELDGVNLRELLEVDLLDVGPATFPSYGGSTAQLRSLFSGAEFAGLPAALVRFEQRADGLEPRGDDRDLVRRAIDRLEGVLRGDVNSDYAGEIDLLRRKLQLAELGG